MRFEMIGINHETSTLDIRDKAAMGTEQIVEQLHQLLEAANIDAAAILSTCNRTELYLSPIYHHREDEIRELFESITRLSAKEVASAYIYRDKEAVNHLFQVASGLNSQLLGEKQVLKQVKVAYYLALESHVTNNILNRVFLKAIECGKAVRHRTGISLGSVSVAGAAVELSRRIFGSLKERNVLFIGAGDTVKLASKFLASDGVESWRISNRTRSNATEIAEKLNAEVVQFPPSKEDIAWADIILSATSSPDVVLTGEILSEVLTKANKIQLFLDLAVPRDIDSSIRNSSNSYLYTVDDFKDLISANLETRQQEAVRAMKIVDKLSAEYEQWYRDNRISPTIKQLKQVLEAIRIEEVTRNGNRFNLEDREQLDKFSKSLMRKVTSLIISNLKQVRGEQDNLGLAKAITIATANDDDQLNEVLEKLEHEFSH